MRLGTQIAGKGGLLPEGILGSRTAVAAVALFVLSLAACLLFVSAYPLPEVRNDAVGYLEIARNVAAGKGFTQDGITPMVYRPPLFSVLLGGWFFLTGTSSVFSVAIFQSLLHALGVSAAFFLFLALTPFLPWAAGASVFLAVNPLLVTPAVFVLQEPAILLFTTLAVLASVRLLRDPSSGRAALAGAAWGACTLAKVVCWFAPFLLLAMRLLPARLRWSWRGREAVLLLLCFAAVIAPWTVRNYIHFHRFIPVNGQGEGLLEWNVLHAMPRGKQAGSDFLADMESIGFDAGRKKEALWRYVKENAKYFLVERVVKNSFWFVSPARDWWWSRGRYGPDEPRPWYWTVHDYLFRLLYLFLAYRTVLWVAGRGGLALGFLILFYWAYWAEHAILWGAPRYGLAIYPLLVAMIFPCPRPEAAG